MSAYPIVTYIDREETKYLLGGWGGQMAVSKEDEELLQKNHGEELLNVRAVANAVVKRIHELDLNEPIMKLSPVRKTGFEIGEAYPMHGIIVVDDIGTARDLENYLNDKFSKQPNRFPRSRGWRAVTTHSKSSIAFDKTHPFFHYKETGRISQNASRILIVVDRATEGMNNKYLGVMGIAKKTRSVLEIVQRLGRLVRSAHYEKDGVLYAPPEVFDMVHVITHEAYDNAGSIQESMRFMLNMPLALDDMLDIETYSTIGVDVVDDDDTYRPTLSFEELFIITDIVGQAILQGKRLSMKSIHNRIMTRKVAKREYITQVARSIYDRNDGAIERVMKALFKEELPEPLSDLAIDDRTRIPPLSMKELEDWLESRGLAAMLLLQERGSDAWYKAGMEVYVKVEGQYYMGEMTSSQTVMATLSELSSEISRLPGMNNGTKLVVENLVEQAALFLLENVGATRSRLEDTGDLNIPAVVAELRRADWRKHVQQWVLWELSQQGYVKNLEPFFALRV